MDFEQYMKLAIYEAEQSLREGNHGFGAIVVKDGEIIAAEHDTEATDHDPTAHAEINAIRAASRKLGKSLSGCVLISTHEPCPMCAFAMVWAGIREIAYGYSIKNAMEQGRKRIAMPCADAFSQAGIAVQIHEGIMNRECAVLYRKDVRTEIEHLRHADERALAALNADSIERRTSWFQEKGKLMRIGQTDQLDAGYRLLLERFDIAPEEMPVVKKTQRQIVFHSMNFCPTLEACRILGLDTRIICKHLNENSTDALLKQLNPRLAFSRNYACLRPYADFCEEMITLQV